jgi:hypothetical protein
MRIVRWIFGGALILFGSYGVGFNWATIPWNSRLAAQGIKRHVSSVPIVGPMMLTMGLCCTLWRISAHVVWFWLLDWPTVSLPIVMFKLWRQP